MREFRMDEGLAPERSSQPTADRSIKNQSGSAHPSLPRQSIESRVIVNPRLESNLRENTNNASAEQLWSKWENELNTATNISTNPSTGASTGATTSISQTSSGQTQRVSTAKTTEPVTAANTNTLNHPSLNQWISELALDERRMVAQGEIDYNTQQNRVEILKRDTLAFQDLLRRRFRNFVDEFNQVRRDPANTVQLYRISNTQADFMLFRNGVKLLVSAEKAGRIVFAFNQYLGQVFQPTPQLRTIEIEASFGVFGQMVWTYRGERVTVDDVARYFFTEFIKQSVR